MVSVPVGPVGIQRVSSHLPRAGDLSCRRRKIFHSVGPLGEPKIPATKWESTPAKGRLRGGRTVVGISKQTGSRKCNPALIGQPLLKPSELNFLCKDLTSPQIPRSAISPARSFILEAS